MGRAFDERSFSLNSDLAMLIARFRWPVASTRWWAMQELATLLLAPEMREEVTTSLLQELKGCKVEAEAVELVCIFWMATKRGFIPPPELGARLERPSTLSCLLIRDCGLSSDGDCEHHLQVAPPHFQESPKFFEMQGADVPRFFLTAMQRLEQRSNLPFVRQCNYEWTLSADSLPGAPYQGDVGHFVRPIGPNPTGAFANRNFLRMASAYQRTLAVARKFWRMPADLVNRLALDVLPLDPTLAFMRPSRPSWLPAFDDHITRDSASVEMYIQSLARSLRSIAQGRVLLSLSTPVHVDPLSVTELSIVRWRHHGEGLVDAQGLLERFSKIQRGGGYEGCQTSGLQCVTSVPVLTLADVSDSKSNAAPLASTYGFSRLGYLQRDLYPSRLHYPVVTDTEGPISIQPNDGCLSISSTSGPIATLSYWNAGWNPVHPIDMSGLCGTALVTEPGMETFAPRQKSHRDFYLWWVTRKRRATSYEAFTSEKSLCGILFTE